MDYLLIAAASLAGLATLLSIVLLVRLRSLGKAVEALTAVRVEPRSPTSEEEAGRQAIADELRRINEQISGFDIVFSSIQDRLSILRPGEAAAPVAAPRVSPRVSEPYGQRVPAATPASAPPRPVPESIATPEPAPRRPEQDDVRTSPEPDWGPGSNEAAAPSTDDDPSLTRLQELVGQYRELIAEPRKSEINRWCDEVGGVAYEVGDDGTLRPLGREAGGLLVLISLEDRVGVVVPGGRLVVDFPTDYANTIAMRRVTRHIFELINDGTGVLRLTEAAVVRRAGDKWQLDRPGTLAGLKSE